VLDDRRFYRPREVVFETHAPRSLVYDALRSGDLRAIRRGSRWLIPGGAVLDWLATQTRDEQNEATL
jgi:excisionase family DNA binding protein